MKASFNLGVEIGAQGIAKGDDFQTATFKLSGVSLADFSSDIIGVRMMSVGPEGNRSYSSKTGSAAIPGNNDSGTTGSTGGSTGDTTSTGGGGSTGDTTSTGGGGSGDEGGVVVSEAAPEPLTILGTLLGGGALVAARKRKANKAS